MSLKKHLQSLTQEDLVEEILKLAKRFKDVKAYYDMDLGGEARQKAILDDYKKKLDKDFVPRDGHPSISKQRSLISEFKKISVFPYDVIDLLLYRVECGVDFTNSYGDMWEGYYDSIAGSYEEALKLIQKNGLKSHFLNRCLIISKESRDIGWGFSFQMQGLIETYLA